MMRAGRRRAGLAAALASLISFTLLAACGGPSKPRPTPLEVVKPQIPGRMVWNYRLDAVRFPLVTAATPGQFTIAGSDGRVVSLDAESGRERWRGDAGKRLSAGVGSDGRHAAVVTVDNELTAFDSGKLLWKTTLASRVTTSPLVAGGRVFVMGVDRIVHAFDAVDGRRLWTFQRPGDALTLAEGSVVAPFKNTLLVAQGPRLAGVDPLTGALRWEVPIATPRGTNEVERLADLIGPIARVGDTVCARAFQSAVGCADAERGALMWTRNVGGNDNVAADTQHVYGADASDRITAWRLANGETAWTSEKLLHRGLSGPVAAGPAVVFGDAEGQVHFLSRNNGDVLLRLPTDGSPVVAAPAASGSTLLVVTRNGGAFAFRPD